MMIRLNNRYLSYFERISHFISQFQLSDITAVRMSAVKVGDRVEVIGKDVCGKVKDVIQ